MKLSDLFGCISSRKSAGVTSNASTASLQPKLPQRLDGHVQTTAATQARRPLHCLDSVRDLFSRAFAAVFSCGRRSAPAPRTEADPQPPRTLPVTTASPTEPTAPQSRSVAPAAVSQAEPAATPPQTLPAAAASETVPAADAPNAVPVPTEPEAVPVPTASQAQRQQVSLAQALQMHDQGASLKQVAVTGSADILELQAEDFEWLAKAGADLSRVSITGVISGADEDEPSQLLDTAARLARAGASVKSLEVSGPMEQDSRSAAHMVSDLLALSGAGVNLSRASLQGQIYLGAVAPSHLVALGQAGVGLRSLGIYGIVEYAPGEPQALQALHQAGVEFGRVKFKGQMPLAEAEPSVLRALPRPTANQGGVELQKLQVVGEVAFEAVDGEQLEALAAVGVNLGSVRIHGEVSAQDSAGLEKAAALYVNGADLSGTNVVGTVRTAEEVQRVGRTVDQPEPRAPSVAELGIEMQIDWQDGDCPEVLRRVAALAREGASAEGVVVRGEIKCNPKTRAVGEGDRVRKVPVVSQRVAARIEQLDRLLDAGTEKHAGSHRKGGDLHEQGADFSGLKISGVLTPKPDRVAYLVRASEAGVDLTGLSIVGELSQDADLTQEQLRSLQSRGVNTAEVVFVEKEKELAPILIQPSWR